MEITKKSSPKSGGIKNFFKENGEKLLYWIPFFIILIASSFETTMFPVYFTDFNSLITLAEAMILAKLLIGQRKPVTLLAVLLAVTAISLAASENSSRTAPLLTGLIAVGAFNIPFRKILKYYIFIAGAVMIAAFIAAQAGIIENLKYITERGVRNSFGIVYPTDFASHIFFLMVSCAVFFEKKAGYILCAAGAAVSALVYIFCKTRLDCICMLVLCAGTAVIKLCGDGKINVSETVKNIFRHLCIWSMPLAAAAMTALTLLYNASSSFWHKFDGIVSGRFYFGKEAFKKYDVTMLGQYINLVGAGGKTDTKADYFFIDCSYIYCLMLFGALFTVMIIAAYVISAMRYRNDPYMLWAIAVISLNCMIAHHLPDCAYSVFAAALFAEGGIPLSEIFGKFASHGKKNSDASQ